MRRQPEAVVFDFYNTLVEIDRGAVSIVQALADLGYYCPDLVAYLWSSDAYDGQIHPTQDGYEAWLFHRFTQLALDVGVAEEDALKVAKVLYDVGISWTFRPLAHAHETILTARALGLRIGLCTNWDYDITPYLVRAGLDNLDAVVTSRQVGARKPHPAPFRTIAKALSVSPESVVFVGDSLNADIVGAMHVGMRAMWINGHSDITIPERLWKVRDLLEVERRLRSLLR